MTVDYQDLILECAADVKEMFRQAVIELTQPRMEIQLRQQWATMPQELKDRLAAEHPEEYNALMKHIGGTNGKNTRRNRLRKPSVVRRPKANTQAAGY